MKLKLISIDVRIDDGDGSATVACQFTGEKKRIYFEMHTSKPGLYHNDPMNEAVAALAKALEAAARRTLNDD